MENKKYDYLIVGSGLFGSVFAHEAHKNGKKVLVIEKREQRGGNVYCKNVDGINVHYYGAHIFHTDDRKIWNYVNDLVEFNRYTNSPLASYGGKLYNLPFNMNTFYQLWDLKTPDEVKKEIMRQRSLYQKEHPENLEEQALALCGKDIYELLIKGYTEKQWGRKATELPAFIIKRIPLRFTFDNNYFNDRYQGIPIGGYNLLIDKFLDGIEVRLDTNFFDARAEFESMAEKIIYTGCIDEYFDYALGRLDYRSLRFEHRRLDDTDNFQGNAVVNYCENTVPYTRIIEHKHFEFGNQPFTFITYEYPDTYQPGKEPYYPVNDDRNNGLYKAYSAMAQQCSNVFFGGRLANYTYADMDDTVGAALDLWNRIR